MSRAIKNSLVDDGVDIGISGLSAANAEKLSGADLQHLLMAKRNGAIVCGTDVNAVKTLGNSVKHVTLAVVASDAVNTVTVDSVASLFVNQIVDIRSVDGATARVEDRTITAIDPVTKVVTYSGADASASIIAGDLITRSTGFVPNATLTGADLLVHSGDQ